MKSIVASDGVTQNYMGSRVHTTFYSVYHNDRLVIRTSDKTLALKIYNELPGPAVNTQHTPRRGN